MKNCLPERLRVVLLDIDGTLVDSNHAHACAWHESLSEAGFHVPVERIRPLIGMGGDKILDALNVIFDTKEAEKRLSERREAIFLERYVSRLRPTPGARELLLSFRRSGYTLATVSAAQKNELSALLKIADIQDLVNSETHAADVQDSKPAPDIVSEALRKANASPEEALLLGDTRYDIVSATKAGVAVVVFRCGGSPELDLAGALAVYDSPADFLVHHRGLQEAER